VCPPLTSNWAETQFDALVVECKNLVSIIKSKEWLANEPRHKKGEFIRFFLCLGKLDSAFKKVGSEVGKLRYQASLENATQAMIWTSYNSLNFNWVSESSVAAAASFPSASRVLVLFSISYVWEGGYRNCLVSSGMIPPVPYLLERQRNGRIEENEALKCWGQEE